MDFFGQMGFDFGTIESETAGFTPLIQSKSAVKKETPAKKEASKTSKKSGSEPKENKARGIKVNYPVTVYGRSFRKEIDGVGETDIQAVAEKLFELGYNEVLHKNVKFFKASENVVVLSYKALVETADDMKVVLPVTVLDGQKKAEYKEPESLGVTDDGDDVTVFNLCRRGINDAYYGDCKLDYDITSDIALPVIEASAITEKNNVLLKAGTVISYPGGTVTLQEPCSADSLVRDYLGEVPEGVQALFSDADEEGMARFLFFGLSKTGDEVSIDRTTFAGVKADATMKKAEEKIALPCNVNFMNFNQSFEVTSEEFGGASKVVWDDMLKYLKRRVRALASADRKVDHLYDETSGILSVAMFYGSKGGC